MDDRFSDQLIRAYIAGVRDKGTLDSELARIKDLLVGQTKHPHPDTVQHRGLIARTNQIFRALLDLKASLSH